MTKVNNTKFKSLIDHTDHIFQWKLSKKSSAKQSRRRLLSKKDQKGEYHKAKRSSDKAIKSKCVSPIWKIYRNTVLAMNWRRYRHRRVASTSPLRRVTVTVTANETFNVTVTFNVSVTGGGDSHRHKTNKVLFNKKNYQH